MQRWRRDRKRTRRTTRRTTRTRIRRRARLMQQLRARRRRRKRTSVPAFVFAAFPWCVSLGGSDKRGSRTK